ncbi:glycoside hydrolase family 72 protein [Cucurbitaria berberidis CBS 394.84]|uniref:1,3-beta-glucanosyltransferase n=1 Tax=Cucurbitaria berberidis CBS 394.84 TaxID=1168544 RepID=A0A9P4GJJ5_9PLEO|nr:glycoside hydrolase family 72 protein [Cucurbitaria berberidis CBS 394.84]KAF1846750.1 glycoside hydrolase family 72 protein [Cucurbitaria berberidis CBS 394.84]
MPSLIRAIALLPALFSTIAHAVHPVQVRGQDFVDSVSNKRLMIIGVDYQPGGQAGYKPQDGQDALTNADVCLRDATVMQKLGVNTIRVYNVDPTLDHSKCASIFNAAGIYMILDVNSPLSGESINRAEPWTSYNKDYLNRVFGVVENFKNFPNTLAFFAANEVMNDLSTAEFNPQYIRAVQRDLKNYIKKHSSRTIPVGYSAADVREILQDTWAYMQCSHKDDASSSDFFGLNSYSWCGADATFQTSGYVDLVNMFNQSAIPVFYSEYGCNKVQPRVFAEVAALYGEQMTSLSGGLVYEYSQEEADYGLVVLNSNGSVSLRQDYDNLQDQFNKLDISLIQSTKPQSTQIKAPECNDDLISAEKFSKNFTIPAVCPGCQDLINNGIKNPKNGKLVDVTETKVKQQVYGSTGVQIQNLELTIVANDGSNTPGGENTSPSGTASAPPQPSTSKKGAASRLSSDMWLCVCLLVAVVLV